MSGEIEGSALGSNYIFIFLVARVCVFGPGIEPIGLLVGETTHFTVATFSTASGFVDVDIERPSGEIEKPGVNVSEDSNLTYTVAYTPKEAGLHKITIRYLGGMVPDSVFPVMVRYPVSEVIVKPEEAEAETEAEVVSICIILL